MMMGGSNVALSEHLYKYIKVTRQAKICTATAEGRSTVLKLKFVFES